MAPTTDASHAQNLTKLMIDQLLYMGKQRAAEELAKSSGLTIRDFQSSNELSLWLKKTEPVPKRDIALMLPRELLHELVQHVPSAQLNRLQSAHTSSRRPFGIYLCARAKKLQEQRRVKIRCGSTFSTDQINTLEAFFEQTKFLSMTDRAELARQLGLTETQVKIWYQNRRTVWRKENEVTLSANAAP